MKCFVILTFPTITGNNISPKAAITTINVVIEAEK